MPVQVTKNKFVHFRYDPDYLKGYDELKTKIGDIVHSIGLEIIHTDINIDGGNVIKAQNKVILTDMIFRENKAYDHDKLIEDLQKLFETEHIIIIPHVPYDIFGHADGMVRFLNEDIVLVSDFSKIIGKTFQEKLEKSLEVNYLQTIRIPYKCRSIKNENGIYLATGCYINFFQIGNLIILPAFGLSDDKVALRQIEELHPNHKVLILNSQDVAFDGGVLNCITWNIFRHEIPLITYLRTKLEEISDWGNAVIGTIDTLDSMEQEIFDAAFDISIKGEWKEWSDSAKPGEVYTIEYEMFKNSDDPAVRALAKLFFEIHMTKERILTGRN